MPLLLETGAYMVGVFLVLLILFPEDLARLARASSSVNSAQDIRREFWVLVFKSWIFLWGLKVRVKVELMCICGHWFGLPHCLYGFLGLYFCFSVKINFLKFLVETSVFDKLISKQLSSHCLGPAACHHHEVHLIKHNLAMVFGKQVYIENPIQSN